METVSIKAPLTVVNLPVGLLWEMDGAAWRAVLDPVEPKGWRWRPENMRAFDKGEPTGEMVDHYPIVGGLPKR